MKKTDLIELKLKLDSLVVFRGLLKDSVIEGLYQYLKWITIGDIADALLEYAEFVSKLYEAKDGNLGEHVKSICNNSENVYVKLVGKDKEIPEYMKLCVENELGILQEIAELTCEQLTEPLKWNGVLPEFASGNVDISESFYKRAANIGKYGYGMYARNSMFYIDPDNRIVPVKNPDSTKLSSLVDYEAERKIIWDNTVALLQGKPAANALITGDAGTGKSSTIKAIVNELHEEGLRIIQVRKDQLAIIPYILDELADNPLKFILFIDDLSFRKDDDNFNALKAVLEGSVSAKSANVVIYATSNRRHIIKETFSEREGDEIHRNDTMQEFVSLSERFGLHVRFFKPAKETYLHIVHSLAAENSINMSKDEIELLAERFALERGGRSARLAKQFVESLVLKQ